MDGSTVPLVDKPSQDKVREAADRLVETFYRGDALTPYEDDLETMYMSKKIKKVS